METFNIHATSLYEFTLKKNRVTCRPCCGQVIKFSLHKNIKIFTEAALLYERIHTTDKDARLHQWYY